MSSEITTEESNQALVPPEEEISLNIDNSHVCSYESFSQDENE